MQITRQHRTTRVAILCLVIVLVLGTSVGVFYMYRYKKINHEPASEQEKSQDSPISKELPPTNNDPEASQVGVGDPHPETHDRAFTTTQPNLDISIQSVIQKGSTIHVSAIISPRAKGTCSFELSREELPPLKTAVSLDGSTCDTDIDVSQVNTGTWTITAKITVASNVATASRPVTLR